MGSSEDIVASLEAQLSESNHQNQLKDKLLEVADTRITLRNLVGASETVLIQLQNQRMNFDTKHMKYLKRIGMLFPYLTTSPQQRAYVVRYNVIEHRYAWVFSTFNLFSNKLVLGMQKRHEAVPFIQPLLIDQHLDYDNLTVEELDEVLGQHEIGIEKATELNVFLTALYEEWVAANLETSIDSESNECIYLVETLLADIQAANYDANY
ncbi:unnamed protein product [Orchesella dallaii]|uniref:Uncharacterized protein n=1 Tax=Orchesella dallaii TaxID=48710 RepID=A0ABP1QTD1_9HEXA